MRTRFSPLPLVAASALALGTLAACGTDTTDGSADTGGTTDDAGTGGDTIVVSGDVTWHRDVRPLAEQACGSCHVAGGAGPFAIDTDELVMAWGAAMVDSVEQQRMPPWQADDECREILHSRAMPDGARAMFAAWRDNDFALGDPADYVAPEGAVDAGADLGEPSMILDPGVSYAPDPSRPDDYRCFLLPDTFDADTFLVGTDVYPDQTSIVHHVLIYRVGEGDVERLERRAEQDENPGFTCFGAVGASSEQVVSAWAPGSQPVVMPDDSAMRIPAGSRLVMQVHYNVLGAEDPTAPPADATTAAFWTLPAGETPQWEVHYFEFIDFRFRIPAGDPDYVSTGIRGIPIDGEIVGALPHMHTLGESISMRMVDESGAEEACVVDLPQWDFNWQQVYQFDEANAVPVRAGDRLELTCRWDNSPDNQPIVNGERIEPRDVGWGDGTYDEMCYAPLLIRAPYWAGSEDGVCGGMEACIDACDAEDGGCLSSCMFGQGVGCVDCMFDNLEPCLVSQCLTETLPFVECLETCEDEYGCFALACRAETDALAACLIPALRDPAACGDDLATCGISMAD